MRRWMRSAAAISLATALGVGLPIGSGLVPSVGAANAGITILAGCGVHQRADGHTWKCTFDDEFDGVALDRTKWVPQANLVSGDASGMYACDVDDPSVISESVGALHLSVRTAPTPVSCAGMPPTNYIAGSVSTWHLFSQEYGRFEVRMRTTATAQPGLQEDFWLWPDDRYTTVNWPATGEIDASEAYSKYPGLSIPYLHYGANDNGGPVPGLNTAWNCAAQRGVWNVYDVVWNPTSVTIAVNGATCLVNRSGDPAFNERYIVALTAALGMGSNAATAATPLPATTDVDYVRVWTTLS